MRSPPRCGFCISFPPQPLSAHLVVFVLHSLQPLPSFCFSWYLRLAPSSPSLVQASFFPHPILPWALPPHLICPQRTPLLPTLCLAASVLFPKRKPDPASPLPKAFVGSLVSSEESPGSLPLSIRPCSIGLLPGCPASLVFWLCLVYASPSGFPSAL